ncbi:hypothetical protein [Borreliella burgdorferi]|uniref:hypothetical protein n=1 Tax=Borreliella burgdorferi TaxID=139 RepID=UPI001FB14519|nr:hypothetical protein [Borreliella burgdorferi]UUX90922.1 hypothetical protein MTX41_06475 [Borreliella burgdorferi]
MIGIGRICLLDKILEAVMPKINDSDNDNFDDNICEKIKKVVDEFNKNEKDEYGYSIMSLNSYPKTKGKDLVKKCINELMKDVEKYLGDVKKMAMGFVVSCCRVLRVHRDSLASH